MSLNDTVSAERLHIGFFGLRNAGKSSLVNAVTGQSLSVVSEVKGTTTDPVRKAMEILPLGPVVIIDTPGLDDEGSLGALRVEKTREVLAKTDLAILVTEAGRPMLPAEQALLSLFREKKLPHLLAYNKADLTENRPALPENALYVSALTGENVDALKNLLGTLAGKTKSDKKILADLLSPGDRVVLVIPVDAAAPKGRLILPQQQVMRELLDIHCSFSACQPEELPALLSSFTEKPSLVITDSQAFKRVAADTPEETPLTSFSILFARYKGELETLVRGARALARLREGDKVLISEGCTHHRQCGDIGSVKLPAWIKKYTGKALRYEFTSGGEFPSAEKLREYSLLVHCGGCMLNEKEMQHRIAKAKEAGVPIVNYGIAIAEMHGILERSLQPFPGIAALRSK